MDIFSVKRRMNVGGPLWWSLDGVSDANVLGAWRFKGRNTKAAAVTDLTKNNRTLDGQGDCSWSQSSGITVSVENRNSVTARYLDNSTIRNNCKSAVLKISGINRLAGTPLTGGWGGISVWLNTPFATQSFWYDNSGKAGIAHGNGRSVNAGGSLARTAVQVATTGDYGSACTIGFTLDGETLYRDGVASSKAIATYVHPGEGDAEDETTMDAEDEMLVDMPENMITLDYSNLEPIPEETLASYQALADAINAINDAIAGGGEGSAVGLNANLSGLPALMSEYF